MKNIILSILRSAQAKEEIAKIRKVKTSLEQKHIKSTRLLRDRENLLELLPTNSKCAEIGVATGAFSERIVEITKPQKLHLIDLWKNGTSAHSKSVSEYLRIRFVDKVNAEDFIKAKFHSQIEKDIVEIHAGFSWEVLESFPDQYFDWIYLDAAHDFESVWKDLCVAERKVKSDGIIAGHDYVKWGRFGLKFGVLEAVNKFCNNYNFEIIYLTVESNTNPSYALKRIG